MELKAFFIFYIPLVETRGNGYKGLFLYFLPLVETRGNGTKGLFYFIEWAKATFWLLAILAIVGV
jgi:hypothetical protein